MKNMDNIRFSYFFFTPFGTVFLIDFFALTFFVIPLDLGAALDAITFFLTVFFVMTVFFTPFNGFLDLVSAFFFTATLITLGILDCYSVVGFMSAKRLVDLEL